MTECSDCRSWCLCQGNEFVDLDGDDECVNFDDGSLGCCTECRWYIFESCLGAENPKDTQDCQDWAIIPSWVERHSVTCIECNMLTDERDAEYSDDNGYLCPYCAEELHKEYADILDWLDEGEIDEDIAYNLSNTRHLLARIRQRIPKMGMRNAVVSALQ